MVEPESEYAESPVKFVGAIGGFVGGGFVIGFVSINGPKGGREGPVIPNGVLEKSKNAWKVTEPGPVIVPLTMSKKVAGPVCL